MTKRTRTVADLKSPLRAHIIGLVDKFGALRAQLSPLEKEEQRIKAELKLMAGNGAYDGQRYRATVSSYTQARLDMDWVRSYVPPRLLIKHTTDVPATKVCVTSLVKPKARRAK
jgi:hypothetical protein